LIGISKSSYDKFYLISNNNFYEWDFPKDEWDILKECERIKVPYGEVKEVIKFIRLITLFRV